MSKPVSCGVLIINENGEILVGLSTGNDKYDIPKGQLEEGERHIEAAIRECKEETGLAFGEKDLTFLGHFNYSRYKDLVLYMTTIRSTSIQVEELVCESTFTTKDGKEYPELSSFMWMPPEEYQTHMFASMQKVLQTVFEESIWRLYG